MSIFQILGCGFLVLILWLVLQQYKSNLSIFVVIAFGLVLFLSMAGQLQACAADAAAAQRAGWRQCNLSDHNF